MLTSLILITACKKDLAQRIDVGGAKLNVKLIGIASESEDLSNRKNAYAQPFNSVPSPPLEIEVPINKNLSAYISLEEEGTKNTRLNVKNKIAASDTSSLTPGIKYGILVYDGDNLIPNGHKIFTAGSEEDEDAFALDGGKTYTFIAYSRNSSLDIPTISNVNKLSEAQIVNESGNLLYYKHTQKVETGVNNLSIILKHKFTQVTTIIQVGNTYAGVIQNISNGEFNKVRQNANLNLLNGDLQYAAQETSSPIQFASIPGGGVKTISSNPNLLIAPSSTNTVTYSFPSITINDTTAAISPFHLNMQAGKKYNLILTFDVPCKIDGFYFDNYEHFDEEIDSMDASYYRLRNDIPLTIDFTKIDNNFNIFYNNKPLFEAQYQTVTLTRNRSFIIYGAGDTIYSAWNNWVETNSKWSDWVPHDADFQYASGNSSIRTMRFSDGDSWGTGSIGEIYSLNGTKAIPVIRIVFSNAGSHITQSISGNKDPGNVNALLPVEAIPVYNYSFTSLNIPPYPIYESSPVVTTNNNATNIQTQTIASIRKTMNFRMNSQFPKNSDGKDHIRIKQSTMSMFPQGGEGPTHLRGFFTPALKGRCEFP